MSAWRTLLSYVTRGAQVKFGPVRLYGTRGRAAADLSEVLHRNDEEPTISGNSRMVTKAKGPDDESAAPMRERNDDEMPRM